MRYEDADNSLTEIYLKIAEERFPNTCANLNVKLMFDTKKRISRGKLILASVEIASEKVKYFTKNDINLTDVDYVVIVDKKAWELASDKDKVRLISHELRHIFIDEDDKRKLLPHDIEDFVVEVKLNEDDPEWANKLVSVVKDIYDQEKELEKENKSKKV